MRQAIAGVTPSSVQETTIWTIWPTIARFNWACWLGRRYLNNFGIANILTVGNLWAVATIPLHLLMYFVKLAPQLRITLKALGSDAELSIPGLCINYRLTNRRVVVQRLTLRLELFILPLQLEFVEDRSVSFDRFDTIEIIQRPGQQWYSSGDLVFRNGNVETFRIAGVPNPGAFRQTCLEARNVYVGIREVVDAA